MTDLYTLLEVAPEASEPVIRAAFRAKAKTAHPDAGGDPEMFRALTTAADTLSDPKMRAAYDLTRATPVVLNGATANDVTADTTRHPEFGDVYWSDELTFPDVEDVKDAGTSLASWWMWVRSFGLTAAVLSMLTVPTAEGAGLLVISLAAWTYALAGLWRGGWSVRIAALAILAATAAIGDGALVSAGLVAVLSSWMPQLTRRGLLGIGKLFRKGVTGLL